MIEDYIPFVRKLVSKYGRAHFKYFTHDELLSYAYEALVNSYRSFNGRGSIEGWISYRVQKSLFQCVRDGDLLARAQRDRVKAGIDLDIEFVSVEDSNVCSNGYHIKQFENRHSIESLIRQARLSEKEKRRIGMYIYDHLTQAEISRMEGVGEAAVSQSHLKTINKLKSVVEAE
jgi:RNA polymerase sigma factor (sigma-70 family)